MKPFHKERNITVYHGDCLDILPELGFVLDVVCITDPPYGVGIEYDVYDDTVENWKRLMSAFVPLIVAKTDMAIMPSCQMRELKWIYDNIPPDWLICWHKGSPGHVSAIGFNDWEPLLVYGRAPGVNMHDHFTCVNHVNMGQFGHPCPKSVRWAKWLIERASKPGDIIIDPFCGSGTVLRAAKDLGRRGIGIDLSEKYCGITVDRLRQETLFDVMVA